jgi:hypothetical protein
MSDPSSAAGETYVIASAMAMAWLAAFYAEDAQAGQMLDALRSDSRGFALAFAALGDQFVNVLTRLERDGALEGGVQVWLDRLALNAGAAADEVVSRYRGGNGE